ncbi:MAG: hypothetical protein ACOYOS_18365 [Syntrophales bacterium]
MKIRFVNNSVSGVNRKYRGFVLDIPGSSTITVDVPSQHVNDAVSYLKYRHPAVICTELAQEAPPPITAAEAAAIAIEEQPTAAAATAEPVPAKKAAEAVAEKVEETNADADAEEKEEKWQNKRKDKKTGGKR